MEQPYNIITLEPKLADAYVVSNGYDFADIVCREHAESFAKDESLEWHSSGDWTLPPFEGGPSASKIMSWESNEVDSPASCGECHVYVECTLTNDGVDYVNERGDFPKWLTDILIP